MWRSTQGGPLMLWQWRIQSWSQGGFPKVANLRGYWRSVPARVSRPWLKKIMAWGGFRATQKPPWIRHSMVCTIRTFYKKQYLRINPFWKYWSGLGLVWFLGLRLHTHHISVHPTWGAINWGVLTFFPRSSFRVISLIQNGIFFHVVVREKTPGTE